MITSHFQGNSRQALYSFSHHSGANQNLVEDIAYVFRQHGRIIYLRRFLRLTEFTHFCNSKVFIAFYTDNCIAQAITIRIALIILSSTIIAPRTADAEWIDCKQVISIVENDSCSVPDITSPDNVLATTHNTGQVSYPDETIPTSKKYFQLAQRDECGSDMSCIRSATESNLRNISRAKEPATPPLTTIAEVTSFRPQSFSMFQRDSKFIFSQYDESGNNFDILAFDITDQSSEYLLKGRPDARFVAQSEKYFIFSERGRFAQLIQVVDRRSGIRVGQIKLRDFITWGKIDGDRLIAIQGGRSGYSTKAFALVFELPTLKIVKSREIVGGNDTQLWKGNILSLGYDLAAYDYNLNDLFKITLPTRVRGEAVSCALTWPLRIHDDKAIIVTNCGELLIYDLPTRQLERTIPAFAHSYTVAVLDGLIFTARPSGDNAHVYDLDTGRELAILPINADDLLAKGSRLLAVKRKSTEPAQMSLYEVNTASIRDGRWRSGEVTTKCQNAAALVDSGDLYGAIRLCKLAGVEGVLDEAKSSPGILSVVRQYGLWLAKTYDRSSDAIAVLKKIQDIAADIEVNKALAEARLKNRALEKQDEGPVTQDDRQSDFAVALAAGEQPIRAETANIDFGAFPDHFNFSEDRIYVGRYGCRRCSEHGASVAVLDRTNFEQIAIIPIAPDDDDYQDNITSIAADDDHIYVSIGYRYEQEGRPNFVVIDKASLKVLKKAHITAPPHLIIDNGRLLTCDCSFAATQSCVALDHETTQTASEPTAVCVAEGGLYDKAVAHIQSDPYAKARFAAMTQDYLIGYGSSVIYPKLIGGNPIPLHLTSGISLDRPVSISGNSVLVTEEIEKTATRKSRIIKLINLPTGTTRTLIGLSSGRSRGPVLRLHHDTLFIGVGHDLIVFDAKSSMLQKYIKNFIRAPFQDNGNGLDMNAITRLMIDRDRLIALTFYGENSQIVPLTDLVSNDL